MEAQYGKFLDMIRAVRINVPLVDVLAGMPNYGKFLKELVSNKHKLEQISSAFLSDESSTMIRNKVPPKLGDLRNFVILKMEEDNKVPLIVGRPFPLYAYAGITVVTNEKVELTVPIEPLRVGEYVSNIVNSMKKTAWEPLSLHSWSNVRKKN
ncbi:hypothetical protein Tco_1069451 [Tanacetum coccineum]|uniref:Reverse transcriptase domain-containing protein n=1 Tax=Tanacetum coccineum TaxID=301880 RepID=A0ABQ5HJZ6_9ASTR